METIDNKAMYVLAELYAYASFSSAHVCLAKSLDPILYRSPMGHIY